MRARDPNPCCAADEAKPDDAPMQPAAPAGKRARGRFATVAGEASPPAASGSIAVSFAIVSFRNWPRRGL